MNRSPAMATWCSACISGLLIYGLGWQFAVLRDVHLTAGAGASIHRLDLRLLKHALVVVVFVFIYQNIPWEGFLWAFLISIGLWWLAIWTSPAPVIGWGLVAFGDLNAGPVGNLLRLSVPLDFFIKLFYLHGVFGVAFYVLRTFMINVSTYKRENRSN